MALPLGALAAQAGAVLMSYYALKLLASLGVGYLVYTGVDLALDYVRAQIEAAFASIGIAQAVAFVAILRIDDCIALILAAMAIRATMKGMRATGELRKLVFGAFEVAGGIEQ